MNQTTLLIRVAVLATMTHAAAMAQNELLFPATTAPWTVSAVGDVNADGLPDLVGVYWAYEGTGVIVRLGRPDGSFGPAASFIVSPEPTFFGAVLLHDVTHDGRVDIVLGGSAVVVLPSVPGGFGAQVVSAVLEPDEPFGSLAIADIDGDGLLDAAVAVSKGAQGCQCVKVFRGAGDGSFTPYSQVVMGNRLGDLMVIDLDADGELDLFATVNPASVSLPTRLVVCLGNGDGSFGPAVETALEIRIGDVSAVDLDGDGLPDLVAGAFAAEAFGAVAVLRNAGAGSFEPAELIVLEPPRTVVGAAPQVTVVVEDLDRNGVPDIVAALQEWASPFGGDVVDGRLFTIAGLGGFAFEDPVVLEVGGSPVKPFAVDLDLDGHVDIGCSIGGTLYYAALAWPTTAVTLFFGRGDGSFELPSAVDAGSLTGEIASGDLDGDGHADLVLGGLGAAPSLRTLLGSGDGTFLPGADVPQPAPTGRMQLADVNRDGVLDLLVVTGHHGGSLQLLTGLGDGSFAPQVTVAMERPADLELADLTGDGWLDLITCDPAMQVVKVRLGRGLGQFSPAQSYPVGGPPRALALGDFDEDGMIDVAVAIPDEFPGEQSPWTVATLRGLGAGVLGEPVRHMAYGAQDLAVADFDRDGHLDLVAARFYYYDSGTTGLLPTSSVLLLRGVGDGGFDGFGGFEHVAIPIVPRRLEVADMNRDGLPDVVASAVSAGEFLPQLKVIQDDRIAVALGSPVPSPIPWIPAIAPTSFRGVGLQARSQPVATAVADFDEDGFPDIAVAQAGAEELTLFLSGASPWATLGYGVAGASSDATPLLTGSGTPAPDELMTLHASGVQAASGLLLVGMHSDFAPFQGSYLVPSADAMAPIVPGVPIVGRWPRGIPPGAPVYLQAIFALQASGQLAVSNALAVVAK